MAVVVLDQHVLTKTSLIDIYITRFTENKTSRAFKTLRRFFFTLHVLDSPLSSNAWFSSPYWTSSFHSEFEKIQSRIHLIRFKLFIFYKPTCLQKNFLIVETISLLVAPWKSDVLKTGIFALKDSLLEQRFVLRTSSEKFFCKRAGL